ncbi:unnamed protein product, partial [Closterium sp. NIES-54]
QASNHEPWLRLFPPPSAISAVDGAVETCKGSFHRFHCYLNFTTTPLKCPTLPFPLAYAPFPISAVNGAVETCKGSFHRFHRYLNFSDTRLRGRFDPEGCAWAYGMNVFDLDGWRRANVTATYHYWQEQNVDHSLWKLGTLPPGLLAFNGLTHAIDPSWHVLGLGYNPHLDMTAISKAAVIHWNGNQKPWLKIALPNYRSLWTKYVNFDDPWLSQCGVT